MRLRIGNVAPLGEVKVEISYMQELTITYNTFYKLQILGTISPRYMNHIAKEDFSKSYAQESSLTHTHGTFNWNFRIKLKTTRKVKFFASQTHVILLEHKNDTATEYTFTM